MDPLSSVVNTAAGLAGAAVNFAAGVVRQVQGGLTPTSAAPANFIDLRPTVKPDTALSVPDVAAAATGVSSVLAGSGSSTAGLFSSVPTTTAPASSGMDNNVLLILAAVAMLYFTQRR